MDLLQSIMAERRADVTRARAEVSLESLRSEAAQRSHHSLRERLCEPGVQVIAEMKKASPSAGLLREDYCPRQIAKAYQEAGAAGMSILTEPRHFLGCGEHLRQVRTVSSLPLLRKDFICDGYQLIEAAAWGADVVLLIVAALTRTELTTLYEEARSLGLEVLVESHTADELAYALRCSEAIIGVNSRDLKTLKTNLDTARALAEEIPGDRVSVAESGIRTAGDIRDLRARGYNGFLVGESLVGSKDPAGALADLLDA
jgi:indole-3-glycerol phosphate synthase